MFNQNIRLLFRSKRMYLKAIDCFTKVYFGIFYFRNRHPVLLVTHVVLVSKYLFRLYNCICIVRVCMIFSMISMYAVLVSRCINPFMLSVILEKDC